MTARRFVLWAGFAVGLTAWCAFISWGSPDYRAFDWYAFHQQLDVIRLAFKEGRVPYHASFFLEEFESGKYWWGQRYLANVYLVTTPDVVLLPLLGTKAFLVAHMAVMFAAAYGFLARWVRDLNLTALSAAALIGLVFFNGALAGRMGVGHLQLTGYFFIPAFLYVVWKLVTEPRSGWPHGLKRGLELGCLLSFLLLQGSLHVVHQMVIACLLLALVFARKAVWLASGLASFALLSTWFILPNVLYGSYSPFADVEKPAYLRAVFCGYGRQSGGVPAFVFDESGPLGPVMRGVNAAYHLGSSFVVPLNAGVDASWEYSLFVGWPGALILLIGLWGACLRWSEAGAPTRVWAWVSAAGVLCVYAIDCFGARAYSAFQQMVFPLPATDRLPSRMMLYPFFGAVLLGAWGLDRFVRADRFVQSWRRPAAWIAIVAMLVVLLWHFHGWFVIETQGLKPPDQYSPEFLTKIYDVAGDDGYKRTVLWSYGASAAFFAAWVVLYVSVRRRTRATPPPVRTFSSE